MNARNNILVLQLGDIGDVVLATPTFRAFKETYPGARVSVLVREGYGSLLRGDPHLFEVLEAAKRRRISLEAAEIFRLILRLRRAKYDLVVDLRTGDRGAILAFFTGAGDRVGRHGNEKPFWHRLLFTRMVVDPPHGPPHAHPGGDQSLRVVRTIGVDTEDTRPRLYLENGTVSRVRGLLEENGIDPKGRFVTINPFSRWKYKEWGYGKWVEVLDAIRERYALPAVIVGAGNEAETAARIADRCRGEVRSMAGKTTLGELAALLSGSTLHLGVDSAAPHIACAVGTPTVTVFGPSDWRAWTVEDDLHRVVTHDKDCVPCHEKGCDGKGRSVCLEELAAGEVLNAVDKVLPAALARPGVSAT